MTTIPTKSEVDNLQGNLPAVCQHRDVIRAAEIAELREEVEQLKGEVSLRRLMYQQDTPVFVGVVNEAASLRAQLAAEKVAYADMRLERDRYACDLAREKQELAVAQAREQQLRDVLARLSCLGSGDRPGNSIGNEIAQQALSLPADTSALDAYVAERVGPLVGALRQVASIAHCGGLTGMSQDGALTAIRRFTLPYFDTGASEDQHRTAIAAVKKGGAA